MKEIRYWVSWFILFNFFWVSEPRGPENRIQGETPVLWIEFSAPNLKIDFFFFDFFGFLGPWGVQNEPRT